jgi:dihydroxyacetone kinase
MTVQAATQVILHSLHQAYTLISAQEDELGKLDAAAGDGDHGAAMVRGLGAAVAAADANDGATPGELLDLAGAAFADAAGGASGALYGTWISTLGQTLGAGPYDAPRTVAAMADGLDTLCTLGKARPGDKTMIDALAPFVAALKQGVDAGQPLPAAWQAALPAAVAGADATAQMVARRGRSARLGERSLGHRDPGAVSMTYLLQAVGIALDEICSEATLSASTQI